MSGSMPKPTPLPAAETAASAVPSVLVDTSPSQGEGESLSPSVGSVGAQSQSGFNRPDRPSSDQWDGPVFSPSRSKDWVACPLMSDLRRRWAPIEVEWEPNRLLGIAINEGLNVLYRSIRDGKPQDDAAIWKAAQEVLSGGFQEGSRWTLEGLEKVLEKVLGKAVERDIVGPDKVLVVDESLGKGRPDVVLQSPTSGLLRVVDTKFNFRLDPERAEKRMSEYDTDDQMLHYAWEAEQYFGVPVEEVGVHLLNATPSPKSRYHPIPIKPARVAFWFKGQSQVWRDMQEERDGKRQVVPRHSGCFTKYGRCPYYIFCHDLGGDESAAENYYNRVERTTDKQPQEE